jgi:cGMP-dependent protein kinase 2
MSGTTAICVLLRGRSLLVANVGDSRAVLAERVDGGVVARDLSLDQTPYREDERERVKARGARVATLDQIEGVKVRGGGWVGGRGDWGGGGAAWIR